MYILSRPTLQIIKLFESSNDLKSWIELTVPPICNSTLTTYCSKLVLVGGIDASSMNVTNTLWTRGTSWQPSLPSMPTARMWASAVNTESPELLIVAGGAQLHNHYLDVVEVLVDSQWITVQPLPDQCRIFDSTVHDEKVYLNSDDAIYQCHLQSLTASIQTDVSKEMKSQSLWSEVTTGSTPRRWHHGLASFGQQLIGIDSNNELIAYSHVTDSWVDAGTTPISTSFLCITSRPAGDLIAVIEQSFLYTSTCTPVFQVSLTSK